MYKPKPMPIENANWCLESCRKGDLPMMSDSYALLAIGDQRDALLLQLRELLNAAYAYGTTGTDDDKYKLMALVQRGISEGLDQKQKCEVCGTEEKDYEGRVGRICPKCNGLCG